LKLIFRNKSSKDFEEFSILKSHLSYGTNPLQALWESIVEGHPDSTPADWIRDGPYRNGTEDTWYFTGPLSNKTFCTTWTTKIVFDDMDEMRAWIE